MFGITSEYIFYTILSTQAQLWHFKWFFFLNLIWLLSILISTWKYIKFIHKRFFYLVWILLVWTNIWTVLTIVNVLHGPSYLLQRTDFGPYFVYWYHPIELFYIGFAFSTDDRVSHYISRPWRFLGSSENMNYFFFSSCSVVFIRMYSSNVSSGKLELLFIRIKYYVIIQHTYYYIIFSIHTTTTRTTV